MNRASPPPAPDAAVRRSRVSSGILPWFAANPVAANLLMIVIFLGGTLSLQDMDKQAYPRFAPTAVRITAEYPGAGPAEVEESVCIPIEEVIHDLVGIKRLSSEAVNGSCELKVQVQQGYETKELAMNIRARTQTLRNLPRAVEKIDIDDTGWEYPAISVVLAGDTDMLTLRHLAERVRDDLSALPGVRVVKLWSTVPYEIAIDVSAERLRQHQLTLADVAEAVRRSSLDLPGGVVRAPTGEFQLRAKSTAYDRDALLAVTLRTYSDGTLVRLGDIAEVTDGFADQRTENASNGHRSETIGVIAQHDLVETARTVKAYVETLAARLPEGISATTRRDNARSFAELLDTLVFEAVTGFLLVLAVLMLFLSTRVALWAAVGIMISVFGALWCMPAAGVTLNMLSLFGFLLALGVLVDDAIIVSERVHELQSRGITGLKGAIQGVRDVAVPVVLGVSIGLIAFLPGLFVPPSWAMRFMKPVAVVMILSLAFSLVEALLILPAHLATDPPLPAGDGQHKALAVTKRRRSSPAGWLRRVRGRLNGGLDAVMQRGYQPFLRCVLNWRYATVALFAGAVLVGWALIHADYVKVSLEEDVGYDNFHVHLRPPLGTPYPETEAKVRQFVEALHQAEAELNALQPPGSPSVVEGLDVFINETDPTVWVEFSSEARRQFHIRDLIQRWYRHVGDVGDFRPDFHTPTEQDVIDLELEISAPEPAVVDAATALLKEKLASFPGMEEIEDSRRPGKPELRLRLTPEAERLGLRMRDLAEQVRHAYYGVEAQRFIRGRDEVKIMVRYPGGERQSLQDLRALPVTLPAGGQAPLAELAEVSFAPGYGALTREDRQGVVSLSVRLNDEAPFKGDALYRNLQQGFFTELQGRYPSLRISGGAAKEEAEQVAAGLKRNTLIALAAIYALIAVSFRSYLQPLAFMLAVPVAWLGAVLIHWTLGLTLSFQSLVGMVAASGVVVNDSIVLLDYMSKRGDTLDNLADLIAEACASRFRPIILVSLTNLAGFFPMLFETSEQAKFLVPMTLSLTFGLLFGMTATLFLIPACYAILNDVQQALRRLVPGSVVAARKSPGAP